MNARARRARALVRTRSRINRGMARRRRAGLWTETPDDVRQVEIALMRRLFPDGL